jgi:chromosome segregation ATPase
MNALVNIDKIAKITITPVADTAKLTIQLGSDDKKSGEIEALEWQQICYRLGVIANAKFEGAEDHLSQMKMYIETLKTQSDSIDALRNKTAELEEVITAAQTELVKNLNLVSDLEKEKAEFEPKLEAANAEVFSLKEAAESKDTALKSAEETIEQLKTVIDDLQSKLSAASEQKLVDMGEASAVVTHDEPGSVMLPPADEVTKTE